MKRLFLIAVALLLFGNGSTEAARNRYPTYRSANRGGVFSRLMELERRKNERLRQIIFGR
jgi:hypothetical protein